MIPKTITRSLVNLCGLRLYNNVDSRANLRDDMAYVNKLCNVIDGATQLADDWNWREADRDYRLEVMSGTQIKQHGLIYGASLPLTL